MPINLRDQIPALKNKYYFNYGGQGPLPKSSLEAIVKTWEIIQDCLLYTSPSPRDRQKSRMPSSA